MINPQNIVNKILKDITKDKRVKYCDFCRGGEYVPECVQCIVPKKELERRQRAELRRKND